MEALKALIKAESRPLVLHIEDAHLLDAESRAFLTRLTRNVEGFPFLLVLTARPEGDFAATADDPRIVLLDADLPQHTLRLEGLNRAALAALGRERLDGGLADPLLEPAAGSAPRAIPSLPSRFCSTYASANSWSSIDDVWDLTDALKQAIAERNLPAVEAALPDGRAQPAHRAPGSAAADGQDRRADGGGARPRIRPARAGRHARGRTQRCPTRWRLPHAPRSGRP